MTISNNSTLEQAIIEMNRLSRRIEVLEREKKAGRNVTGARAVPSSSTDIIAGDIVGDYLYDGYDRLCLEVIDNSGTLEWRVVTEAGV